MRTRGIVNFILPALMITTIILTATFAYGETLLANTAVCITPTDMKDNMTLIMNKEFESAEAMYQEGKCIKNYEPIHVVVLDKIGDYRKIRFKYGDGYLTRWTHRWFLDK